MKRFEEFLAESRIDEELDASPKEIWSIDSRTGELVFEGMEDETFLGDGFEVPPGEDPFQAIAAASWEESEASGEDLSEGKDAGDSGRKTGWGGEVYVSLDFPDVLSEAGKAKGPKEDSRTLKDLLAMKKDADSLADRNGPDPENWSEIARRRFQRYSVEDGKLSVTDPESGEVRPVTPEEARAAVAQKTNTNT